MNDEAKDKFMDSLEDNFHPSISRMGVEHASIDLKDFYFLQAWLSFAIDDYEEQVRLAERRQAFKEALEIVGKPKKRKATHGSCCTCQTCGYAHDECECDHNRTIDEIRTKLQEKINELEAQP